MILAGNYKHYSCYPSYKPDIAMYMFSDSQSGGKTPVVSVCVKIICSTGDSFSAQCFNV